MFSEEKENESFGIGEEDLPQVQGDSSQGRGSRHLHGPAPQAASRLIRDCIDCVSSL
jgi:hypothetical protein